MVKRTVLSYGSLKLPDYARTFFKDEYEHIAFIRDDNYRLGAIEGCTWRVYPANLLVHRENFARKLFRILQWAEKCGAETRIVHKNFPKGFATCRRGDFIAFAISEPVATMLEQFGCLPQRHGFAESA